MTNRLFKEPRRKKAIEMRKKGKQIKEIAAEFGLNPATISRWLKEYREEGREG